MKNDKIANFFQKSPTTVSRVLIMLISTLDQNIEKTEQNTLYSKKSAHSGESESEISKDLGKCNDL